MMGSHCEKAVGEDGGKVNVGIQKTSNRIRNTCTCGKPHPFARPNLFLTLRRARQRCLSR